MDLCSLLGGGGREGAGATVSPPFSTALQHDVSTRSFQIFVSSTLSEGDKCVTDDFLTAQQLISDGPVYFSLLLRKELSLTLVTNIVKGKYFCSSSKVNPSQLFCGLTSGQRVNVLLSLFSVRFKSSSRLWFWRRIFRKKYGSIGESQKWNPIVEMGIWDTSTEWLFVYWNLDRIRIWKC